MSALFLSARLSETIFGMRDKGSSAESAPTMVLKSLRQKATDVQVWQMKMKRTVQVMSIRYANGCNSQSS